MTDIPPDQKAREVAEIARLKEVAENFVQAVETSDKYACALCSTSHHWDNDGAQIVRHAPDCPIVLFRIAMAAKPIASNTDRPSMPDEVAAWMGWSIQSSADLGTFFRTKDGENDTYLRNAAISTLHAACLRERRLREALAKIVSNEPCVTPDGRIFCVHHDADGEIVGEQDIDPVGLVGHLIGIARLALEPRT